MGRRKTAVGGQSSSSSRHYAETGQSSSSSRHSVEMDQSSPSSRHSVEMDQSSPSSRHSVRTKSSRSSRHSVRTESSPSSRHSVRTQSSPSSRHSVRTQSSRSSRHSVRTQSSRSSRPRHSVRTQSSRSSRHSVRTQSSPSRDSLEMGQSSSSSNSGSLPSSSCRHSIEVCQSCSCPSIRHCSGIPVQNPDFSVVAIQCNIPADVLSNNSDTGRNKKRQNENAEQLTNPKRIRTEQGHENLENYPEIDPVALVRQMEEDERMARMLQENETERGGSSRENPHVKVENSPEIDPVELVRQVEEDEGLARQLQAQFYEANDTVAQEERDDRGFHPHGDCDSSGGHSRENPHEQLENSLEFDPLAQVIQMEEDERVARMLQAQFEAEGGGNSNFEQLANADPSDSVLNSDENEEGPNSTSCAMCLSDYADGDEIKLLPCFHKFHKPCVDPWLMKNPTCPVCRVTADTHASYQHSYKSNQHRHPMFEH